MFAVSLSVLLYTLR